MKEETLNEEFVMLSYLMDKNLSFRDACLELKVSKDRLKCFLDGELSFLSNNHYKKIRKLFANFCAIEKYEEILQSKNAVKNYDDENLRDIEKSRHRSGVNMKSNSRHNNF